MSKIEIIEFDLRDLSEDARIRFLQQLRELLHKYEFDWILHGEAISVPILSVEMVENNHEPLDEDNWYKG